jgi:hypothetical protein
MKSIHEEILIEFIICSIYKWLNPLNEDVGVNVKQITEEVRANMKYLALDVN